MKALTAFTFNPVPVVTKKAKNRCKGSFDNNMEIYKRMGLDNLVTK